MTNDSVYCKFRLVLLTAMLAAGLCLSAQTRVTVHYDEDSGLSSPLVGGGVQDRDGLMWFATWNGLNCYDGYSFHRVSIVPGDSASIGTNLIRDILLTSDGDILCHTDSDVYIFDLSSFSFRDVPPQQHDSLMSLVGRSWHGITDRQGILWTADRSGLYKSYVPLHPAEILTGSEGIHPRSFLLAHDSVLWVGSRTDWSLRRYRDDSVPLNLIDLPTAPYCIFQTLRGDVWVGGKPAAMCRIIADSVVGENISDVAVYDIREDAYGRLWVATFGDGVKCCPYPEAERPVLSP
ncbi:MAG: hypothetical protein K2K92_08160, partial [Duncaniella sp.]|nr:hypothetical protein [Duncaniella sp.]